MQNFIKSSLQRDQRIKREKERLWDQCRQSVKCSNSKTKNWKWFQSKYKLNEMIKCHSLILIIESFLQAKYQPERTQPRRFVLISLMRWLKTRIFICICESNFKHISPFQQAHGNFEYYLSARSQLIFHDAEYHRDT